MALPYIRPGVTVSELINPTFTPVLAQPTSIAIVGPAQGFQTNTEIVLLQDNTPVQLALTGIDESTLVVVDASDPSGAPFINGSDFTFDPVTSNLSRAMQTQIANGEQVTLYYENPVGVGYTEFPTLSGLTGYAPLHRSTTLTPNNIFVQHQGIFPSSEYVLTLGDPPQLAVSSSPTILTPSSTQTVYVDYDDTNLGVHIVNLQVVLNGQTPVTLPENSINHIVKNAPTTSTDSVFLYQAGSTTDLDYILTGLSNSNTGENVLIQRSAGTTTMGTAQDALQVQVSYSATASDYFQPTRVFSQSDVEEKYGPAFDSSGNVVSPLSLATSICFANGATNMVCQALFHLSDSNDLSSVRSQGGTSVVTTDTLTDWRSTLAALRDVDDVNVIIPIVSASTGSTNDSLTLGIFQALQSHLQFMVNSNVYIVALCGEDSTATGNVADKATLQSHGEILGAATRAEATALVAPAAFQYANPVTGTSSTLGGQYMAAALGGMIAANPVQASLTRKQVIGFTGVQDFRSEMDKDADAASGLLEVESKQGIIRVRHAITTAVNNANTRELSVIRAKYYMASQVQQQLDLQIVGQVFADTQAPLTVQLAVEAMLEQLISQGVIVTYQDVQSRVSSNDPTAVEVRYSYLPAFPLNYINIIFSINTASGQITSTVGQAA